MEQKRSPAHARLAAFFDVGTFVEIGAYLCRSTKAPESVGVVCGYGALEGRLVFAFSEDATALHGAVDAGHAAKIALLYEKARRAGAPVIGMFDSAGAVVADGAAALGAYGKMLATVSGAKGKIPQIALISGNCVGTMAAIAALFDMTVAVKGKSRLYITSPAAGTGVTGDAEELAASGAADLTAETESEALSLVRELLSYLPDSAVDGAPADLATDDINRMLAIGEKTTAREALEAAVDNGKVAALTPAVAPELVAGLGLFGGCSAVALATDGELTLAGACKMTKLLRLAGSLGLPVVSFVNCTGLAKGQPEAAFAEALADLALAWSRVGAAKVVCLVGDAIGAGFLFCGARSLGADTVLALPGSEIAALGAATAVAFLYNDKITPETSRKDLEDKWRAEVATAECAATSGEIDDIVAPAELRARIIAALYMLAGGQGV